jgi:hypothetical protein
MSEAEVYTTEIQRIRRALESIAISLAGMNDIAAREVWYRPTPRPITVDPAGEDDSGEG